MSNSSSWPWPSSATTPTTSPGWTSNETSWSLVPEASPRTARRGFVSAARAAALPRSPAVGRRSTTSPSISSTIRSSDPAVTSTTPTVAPSRRTVARSQTAAISIMRCEMKMMQRSPPRWRPTTSSTRSVRFAGRAAVISSSIRTSGSIASARARSMIRSVARGRRLAIVHSTRSFTPSSSIQWRKGSTAFPSRRRFDRMSRSGMSAGSWYTETIPPRRASPGERTVRFRPRMAIVPASGRTAPLRILTSVLLPAPLAPMRAWTSPGRTERDAERRATTAP